MGWANRFYAAGTSSDLVERVKSKRRRDGWMGLLLLALSVSAKEPFRRHLTLDGTLEGSPHVFDSVSVEAGTESEITYTGLHEPPHPAPITAVEGRAVANPRTVYEFRNATLLGSRPIIRVGRRYVLPSTIGTRTTVKNQWNAQKTFHHNVSFTELFRRPESRDDAASSVRSAFLLTGHFDEFGHWTFEILPKLRAYEEYVTRMGNEPPILTQQHLTTWQQESLTLLGYPPEALSYMGDEPIHVQRLLVPSHRYLTWAHVPSYPSRRDLQWVADRIKRTLRPSERSFGQRIFISREDAPRRHVRNRRAVYDVLEAYDFEIYEPGRLSFADQVRLFAGADIIVGPYGAGVSNIVFAEDAQFVELIVDAEKNIHHYVLANLLGIDYEYVRCQPHAEPGVKTRNSDLIVDIEQLRDVLESLVST